MAVDRGIHYVIDSERRYQQSFSVLWLKFNLNAHGWLVTAVVISTCRVHLSMSDLSSTMHH